MSKNYHVETYNALVDEICKLPLITLTLSYFDGRGDWFLTDTFSVDEETKEDTLNEIRYAFQNSSTLMGGWKAHCTLPNFNFMDIWFVPRENKILVDVVQNDKHTRHSEINIKKDEPVFVKRVLNEKFFNGGRESWLANDVEAAFEWVEDV